MRKEEYFDNAPIDSAENGAGYAARYVTLSMKTEGLIKMMGEDRYFRSWSDADIDYAIRKADVFDFSLDDILFIRKLTENEQYRQIDSDIGFMFDVMKDIDQKDRMTYYQNQVIPRIEERDAIKRAVASTFGHLVYYADQSDR